jgi:RimJ/RimL family protein N-acetyltransferase
MRARIASQHHQPLHSFGGDIRMSGIEFKQLKEPTSEIAATMGRWENDAELVPYIRHSANREDSEKKFVLTIDDIQKRLQSNQIYLIYMEGKIAGEMSYQIDPPLCYHKVTGTAWISIIIGEKSAHHKGIGHNSMRYLENEIRGKGLKRIELGVFEFNENARRLYLKLGYVEIGRINDFTYWSGKMWQDIRMEKLLS